MDSGKSQLMILLCQSITSIPFNLSNSILLSPYLNQINFVNLYQQINKFSSSGEINNYKINGSTGPRAVVGVDRGAKQYQCSIIITTIEIH